MGSNNRSGAWGEEVSAGYLSSRGYRILERNYRIRGGEIDIVAEKGRYIVFVEVKTRKSDRYGSAAEYVGLTKMERIRRTAEYYLASHPTEKQPRFDVIEVYAPQGPDTGKPDLRHIADAFS